MRPARPHRRSAEFVVFRVALSISRPVNELHDIHRGYAAKLIKKFRFSRFTEVLGQSIPEAVDVVADIMHRAKHIGGSAGPAGIADILLPLADFLEIGWLPPPGMKQVDLERQPAKARDTFQHVLQRRVGDEAAIPVVFAIDLHCRKAGRQSAAGHDMLGPNGHLSVVEVREIAGAHIYGTDAKADFAGVDAIELDQLFERILQRARIVIARRRNAEQPVHRWPRREETGLPEQEGVERARATVLACYRAGQNWP